MTPAERELALRKKAEKRLRKGIQVEVQEEPIQEVIIDHSEVLPEEPAIRPRRRRNQAA